MTADADPTPETPADEVAADAAEAAETLATDPASTTEDEGSSDQPATDAESVADDSSTTDSADAAAAGDASDEASTQADASDEPRDSVDAVVTQESPDVESAGDAEAPAPVAEAGVEDLIAAEGPDVETPEGGASDASASAAPTPAAPAKPSVPAAPAVPTPSAVPRPTPMPRPAPGASAAPRAAAPAEPWGRVEDDGTVSVREAGGWRVVGQYPDGTPDEALAYFERKYADLASEVTLLEVRLRRGGASASDIRTAARAVSSKLDGAAAVGDLAALQSRVDALTESLAAASETEAAAAREAVDEAIRTRTALVERAEALAARDPKSVQWKQASADMSAMFDDWQSQQSNGPRLPKSTAQQLWKRFRDARATVDRHRREFYAGLDEAHKGVRDAKARLVEKAEALAPKGEDGIGAYRELLDQWKTTGRAGKKADDALWAKFKAAGDALYSARSDREAADAEASREKIEQKRALLVEAKVVVDEKDLAKARSLLTGIQRQWDDIGRIFPRDTERSLDDELRRIEQGVRSREDVDWKRNDPEQKARANDMTRQLTDAIEKLEAEVAAKTKAGDKAGAAKAAEALEARRSWLKALGG